MLGDAGIAPNTVSPRLFLPILEHASLEHNEEMQGRWAALLANASAKEGSVHPSFIEILDQLTPEDAQLLDRLYESCQSNRTRRVTPWVDTISYAERERRMADGENPMEPFQNLVRIGLIRADYDMDEKKIELKILQNGTANFKPPKLESGYELTDFAVRFIQACRAPEKQTSA
jgi:hypothetical protein